MRPFTYLVPVLSVVLIGAFGCAAPDSSPVPAEEQAAEEAPAPPKAPEPLWKQHLDQVHPTIEAWAEAWSNQDVEAYLDHYSDDFRVPGTMSREAWEAQRRRRLTAPSEIVVEIENLYTVGFKKAFVSGKQRELVKVRFRQRYQSDTFSDEVDKEIEVELVDGSWKFLTETSV